MSITESLVSSFILMLLASQSGRIFSESVRATGKATLRDQISISISSDLEQVRNMAMLWKADKTNMSTSGIPINGEMIYTPTDAMCEDNTLAKDLILSSDMAQEGILTSSESSSQRTKTFSVTDTGISIERTIKSESSNHNLLKVNYLILSNSFPNSIQSTTLMIPAQAWCRS